MDELTMVALRCLVMLFATAFTTILIPFIKDKIGEYKWKRLKEFTEYAVRFAEQKFTPEEWKEKKDEVYRYIREKALLMDMELTEKDIDILVEGFVNLVKHPNKENKE